MDEEGKSFPDIKHHVEANNGDKVWGGRCQPPICLRGNGYFCSLCEYRRDFLLYQIVLQLETFPSLSPSLRLSLSCL